MSTEIKIGVMIKILLYINIERKSQPISSFFLKTADFFWESSKLTDVCDRVWLKEAIRQYEKKKHKTSAET